MKTRQQRITPLLEAWKEGKDLALHELIGEVVFDLRRLAGQYFAHEKPNHTLQPTALVNEVYLRLEAQPTANLENQGQFFAHVSRLMREILVDHARARLAHKRGGGIQKVQLSPCHDLAVPEGLDVSIVLALDETLQRLDRIDPRLRQTAELRYFGGLTLKEIAGIQEVSLATVERSWRTTRRWLARELSRRR